MRFLANLKDYFSTQKPPPFIEPPASRMEGLEVDFHPVPASRVNRKLGRLLSLYRARVQDQAVYDEILRYRKDLEAFGHTGLTSEAEVLALIEQLNGD
jgi:hypothetical protein